MNIFSIIGSIFLALASLFGVHQQQSFGAVNAGATPLFDTVLTQQLGTSDNTMYLKSMTDSQGNVLTGYQCVTVDVNSPSVEYICGTVSGLTLTGLTRNLSYQTGTTTYATPTNIHRVGADVRITDFPGLAVLTNQALGKETYQNPLIYATHPCSVSSASGTICDKYYIDSSVVAGGSPFSSTVAGVGMLATAAQAASSTGTGVYNGNTYNRALWSSYATDTPNTGSNTSDVIMSDLTGHIKQGWLDLTQVFPFTGGILSTASSTFTTAPHFSSIVSSLLKTDSNGLISAAVKDTDYALPAYTSASSTSFSSGSINGTNTTVYTDATSSTVLTIPAGTLSASSTIEARAYGTDSAGICNGTCVLACTLYLRTSSGKTLGTIASGVSQTSVNVSGSLTVVFPSSLTSETSVGTYSNSVSTGGGGGGATTASVDFTAQQSLVVVAEGYAHSTSGGDSAILNSCTASGFTIVAR